MRVLLDECLPRKLRRELPEHEVRTVLEAGWSGTKNGELLRRAAAEFDVFITVDANIPYQQNTSDLPLAIVVLVAYSNDVEKLKPLMPNVRQLLATDPGRALYRIGPAS